MGHGTSSLGTPRRSNSHALGTFIPHRVVPSGGHGRCGDGYDVTVDVQSAGPNAARVNVGLSCLNATGSRLPSYHFERYYEVVRVGDKWFARFVGFSITMPGRALPNITLGAWDSDTPWVHCC
jgi:hypothetical protein